MAIGAPPSVLEPVRSGATRSQDAAVVVGNEDYAYLPSVPYAGRDADAFQQLLIYTVGVPAERVRRLDAASREQILRAVEEARAEVGEDGTLWVYYAGHGAASPVDGRPLLLGDDTKVDMNAFVERSVAVEELRAEADPGRSVVVLDACYTGASRDGASLLPGARFAIPSYVDEPVDNQLLWTAASPSEISGPFEAAQHGRFTYFLVGALQGWADGELDGAPDGQVTREEADAYVARALSTLQVRDQHPTSQGGAGWVVTKGTLASGPDLAMLGGGTRPAPVPRPSGDWLPPIESIGGRLYQDAEGRALSVDDLGQLASRTALGQRTAKQHRTARTISRVTTGAAVGSLAISGVCMALWDVSVPCRPVAAGTGVGAVGFGVTGMVMAGKRRRHERALLEQSNQALSP